MTEDLHSVQQLQHLGEPLHHVVTMIHSDERQLNAASQGDQVDGHGNVGILLSRLPAQPLVILYRLLRVTTGTVEYG